MLDLNGPIDPSFNHPFIPEEHEEIMRKKVVVSHLDRRSGGKMTMFFQMSHMTNLSTQIHSSIPQYDI
jgi:hypothetical protein